MKMFTKTLSPEQEARVKKIGFDYAARAKKEVTECNLCSSKIWTKLTHHDRYYHETEAFQCQDCGNVFITPLMTEKEYHSFYADYYRPLVSAYHGRTIDAVTLQDDQHPYADDLAEFIGHQIRAGFKPKAILDVGGSTGIILKRLEREFQPKPRLLCLDPAVNELNEAKKLGLEVINGFIESHDFGSQRFDLILLCQTIDHLADIRLSLKKMHEVLSDDGLFFVDAVDFRKIYLKTGSVEGAIKIDHCYYLADHVTEAYLQATGFEVIRKGIARDKVHINYLCRKTKPRELDMPELKRKADAMYAEIRQLREEFFRR